MKNNKLVWLLSIVTVLFAVIINSSCNKKFDEPPYYQDANLPVNYTIKALKALHLSSGSIEKITDDITIAGIVVCDDSSGNYYHQIAIQDSTGGILVRMDASNLYTDYPVGRKIYIKARGLALSDYGGVVQLGLLDNSNNTVGLISSALIPNYIFKGSLGNVVIPKVVTPSQLTTSMQDPYQSTLIQLDNFEFTKADTSKNYANAGAPSSVNYIISNCSGEKITLRNSNFASFASIHVATGNGTIIGIASSFGTTKQLTIRDTSDVQFYYSRCGVISNTLVVKPIQDIRAIGSGNTIPANTAIEGVIISDTKNEASGSYRIQNVGGSGINFIFTRAGAASYKLNDVVRVDVSNLPLSTVNGELQIAGNAPSITTGIGSITPQNTTIPDIFTNKANLASEVVTIKNVKIRKLSTSTAGTTYSLSNGTDSIESYVRSTLTYTMPDSASSVTGYVATNSSSRTNGAQLTIRNSGDVIGNSSSSSLTSIAALRNMYQGADVPLTNMQITGVVISDATTANLSKGTLIIQDATAGIDIFYGSTLPTTGFNIGDSVIVDVSGGTLTSYNGLIEVTKLKTLPTTKLATGITVIPKTVTIADFVANIATYECTLVKVVNATVTNTSGTYSGNATLSDASGTTILRTASGASFSSSPLPTTSKTFVGYGTRFNTPQLNIRNLSDVQ